MIAGFLIALASAASVPVPSSAHEAMLQEAARAIAAGRLDQAHLMTGRAISNGVRGAEIDRVLADLAFANADYAEAFARYESLLVANPADGALLERAGIAALNMGFLSRAAPLITSATKAADASWRAWNALGVLADLNRDWSEADDAYARAVVIAPEEASVINNRGWSRLLRGDWPAAIQHFERAAVLAPNSARIMNNLELARAALAADLPQRSGSESDQSWAQRLNDAGVAAQILGDKPRAIAAFTQALEASGRWYARAANNLEAATQQ